MKQPIVKVFENSEGDGLDLEFESAEAELLFWNIIATIDKASINKRIIELINIELIKRGNTRKGE